MINNISKTSSVIRLIMGLSFITLIVTSNTIESQFSAGLILAISGLLLVSGIFRSCPFKMISQEPRGIN